LRFSIPKNLDIDIPGETHFAAGAAASAFAGAAAATSSPA
jgi:hypothetical protein